MKMAVYLLGMLALPASLVAGPCDFQTNGDPRNGLDFKGQVHVPGLSVQSALGQLRRYALEGGFQLGQELIKDSSGELSFIQATNKPALVVWAKADSSGRVSLSMKLARGQKVEPAAVEKEFCTMLAKLKTGEEGEAIAAEARAKSGSGRPIDAQAVKLSQAIGKEVEKAISPVTNKYSFRANFLGYVQDPKEMAGLLEPIRLKYLEQKYRIDGQVFRTNRHDPISFASDLVDRFQNTTTKQPPLPTCSAT